MYWNITPQAPGTSPGAFALSPGDSAHYRLSLMPHISMGPRGFVRIIAISAAFLALPLLGVLGTPVLWGLLPFAGLALWALWYALSRNSAERHALREDLYLTKERIEITRTNPRKPPQHWDANPYWVRVKLAETDGVIENYLTLEGNGRVVELGAFLSPEERVALYAELSLVLRHLR
jgi:uncharacterized membrane protein